MQVNIQGAERPIVGKGISSNKNHTEAICETSYCSVHSSNRVEPQCWLSSSETLFLYEIQVDIQGAMSTIVEKGKSSHKKYTEAICETTLCSVHSTNGFEPYF